MADSLAEIINLNQRFGRAQKRTFKLKIYNLEMSTKGRVVTNRLIDPIKQRRTWATNNLKYYFLPPSENQNNVITTAGEFGVSPQLAALDFISIHPSMDGNGNPNEKLRNYFHKAFREISNNTALNLSQTNSFTDADLKIGLYTTATMTDANGVAWGPDNLLSRRGNISINIDDLGDGAEHELMLHEIMHSVGFDHPFHDNPSNTSSKKSDLDHKRYSVLSYTPTAASALSLSPADLKAIAEEYGNSPKNSNRINYVIGNKNQETESEVTITGSNYYYTVAQDGKKISTNLEEDVLINLNSSPMEEAFQEPWRSNWNKQLEFLRRAGVKDRFQNYGQPVMWDHLSNPIVYFAGIYSYPLETFADTEGGFSIAHGITVNTAEGGKGNDILIGNKNNNLLKGFDGNNIISGGAGADTIETGKGKNIVSGGDDDDTLIGEENGENTAYYSDICKNYEIFENKNGSITVNHVNGARNDGKDTLLNYDKIQFRDSSIDLNKRDSDGQIKGCRNNKLDIIYVLDFSKSFSNDLPGIAQSARTVTSTFLEENPRTKFAIASFLDYPFEPFGQPGEWLYRAEMKLGDADTFEKKLNEFAARSSNWNIGIKGDAAEAQWFAMYQAAKGTDLNLRKKSNKLVVLLTDSPAHTAETYGLTSNEVTEELENAYLNQADEAESQLNGDGRPETPQTFREINLKRQTSFTTRDPLVQAFDDEALKNKTSTGLIIVNPDSTLSNKYQEQYNNDSSTAVFTGFSRSDSNQQSLDYIGLPGMLHFGYRRTFGGLDQAATEIGDANANELSVDPNGTREIWGLANDDTLNGSNLDDTLHGGSGEDEIYGRRGADIIYGGAGNDYIDAGPGNDIISPGANGSGHNPSSVSVFATDTIISGTGKDLIEGYLTELNQSLLSDFNPVKDKIIVKGVQRARQLTIEDSGFDGTNNGIDYNAIVFKNVSNSEISTLLFPESLGDLDFTINKIGNALMEVKASFP